LLDTSHMTIEQAVEKVLGWYHPAPEVEVADTRCLADAQCVGKVLNNLTQPRQFRCGWLTFLNYVYSYQSPASSGMESFAALFAESLSTPGYALW
jgi:hypothetical protein